MFPQSWMLSKHFCWIRSGFLSLLLCTGVTDAWNPLHWDWRAQVLRKQPSSVKSRASKHPEWVLPLPGANPKPRAGGFIWKLHLLLIREYFWKSTIPSHITSSSLTIHMSLLCQVNDRIWRDQSSFHTAPAVVQQGFGAAFIQHSPSRKPHSGAAWFLRAGICLSPNHEFKSRFSRRKQRISLCPCCSFQGPGPSPSLWAHRERHFKYPSWVMELDKWEIPAPSLQQGMLQIRKGNNLRVLWTELGLGGAGTKGVMSQPPFISVTLCLSSEEGASQRSAQHMERVLG